MDKVNFALERVRRTSDVDELMAAGEILAAEVERLRDVTRGDGGRIFALQAEVERLRDVEIAAVAALNAGDDRRVTAWRRLRDLTQGGTP